MALVEVGRIAAPAAPGSVTTATAGTCKAVILWSVGRTADGGVAEHMRMGIGFATYRSSAVVNVVTAMSSEHAAASADCYSAGNTNAALKLHNGTTGALSLACTLTNMNSGSNGFALNFSATISGAIVNYIAFTGTDVADAIAGSYGSTGATGAQDVALAAGFGHPDLVFAMAYSDTGMGDAIAVGQNSFGWGIRSASGNGRSIITYSQDAAATQATVQQVANNKACGTYAWGGGTSAEMEFTLAAEAGWPTDGFELNFTTDSAANRTVFYLALRFSANVTVTHGENAMRTTTGLTSHASSGTPALMLVAHTRQTTANTSDSTGTDDMLGGIGASDGTTETWAGWSDDDAQATASVCGNYQATAKTLRAYTPPANALDTEADCVVNGSNFDLDFTDAAPSAFLYEWLTLGVAGVASAMPDLNMAIYR